MQVGFVGLGALGQPLALNLVAAGHTAACWARRPEQMRPLLDAGATACTSAADVAAHAEVVVTCVADATDLEQVVLGRDGIADGAAPGTTLVDHGTGSPTVARVIASALAAVGVHMLDAPVSGSAADARARQLVVMVGGEADVFERMRPVLGCSATHVRRVGESGAGQVARACDQIASNVMLEAVAEALHLAARSGLDPARVRDALAGGYAWSRMLERHAGSMLEGRHSGGCHARLHAKDLNHVLHSAHALGLALPLTALVTQHFNALVGSGDGERDGAALVTVLQRMGRA
ncbi:MAG: NAD(P)-dependent oxidoreductase [Burkholderiales bacterium]|nr:NAD(P)-dependent oxidoreductase [Burkholderiales bacterium]